MKLPPFPLLACFPGKYRIFETIYLCATLLTLVFFCAFTSLFFLLNKRLLGMVNNVRFFSLLVSIKTSPFSYFLKPGFSIILEDTLKLFNNLMTAKIIVKREKYKKQILLSKRMFNGRHNRQFCRTGQQFSKKDIYLF